ncbi:MAG: hypothetical protein KCHDKBKB_03011 [Elusimicrobia bacterium]|nr:hypothetical protein [Elusimicrobiota bacterium]
MAKAPKPQVSTTPSLQSVASTLAHTVKIAHPEELPGILTTMERDGWQLITIVACRYSNEHAAYFRKQV